MARKARKKGETGPDTSWHEAFLKNLARTGAVMHSANKAGIHRDTAYDHRDRFPEFAEAWDHALDAAVEDLELVCRNRARDYSDLLLIFLLKAHRPERYRETRRFEVTGPDGGAIEVATPKQRMERMTKILQKATDGDDEPLSE
jgi:hypothetical protein